MMTKEEKIKLLREIELVPKMDNILENLPKVREILLESFLGMPFDSDAENKIRGPKQRVIFMWGGMDIIIKKTVNDLPPPTPAMLHEALQGLIEDSIKLLELI